MSKKMDTLKVTLTSWLTFVMVLSAVAGFAAEPVGPAHPAVKTTPRPETHECTSSCPPTPAPVVTTPRLYVLDCGTITNDRPELYGVTRDEVKFHDFANMCYLLVHPKGVLLFDTGLSDTLVGRPLYESYVWWHDVSLGLLVTRTLRSQLADIGYTPDVIDYLLLSHSHFDHIGNVGMFSKSTWLVQRPEWDFMFGMKDGKPTKKLELFSTMNATRTVFVPEDDYDIFGDGVAIIKRAYGHTPGQNVLVVSLRDTGKIILAGDLYHYPEERTLKRIGEKKTKSEEIQTRANIEDWAERNNAQMWLTHDMSLYQFIIKSPGYYQ